MGFKKKGICALKIGAISRSDANTPFAFVPPFGKPSNQANIVEERKEMQKKRQAKTVEWTHIIFAQD